MFFDNPNCLKQKRFNFDFMEIKGNRSLNEKPAKTIEIEISGNKVEVNYYEIFVNRIRCFAEFFTFHTQDSQGLTSFQQSYLVFCRYFDLLQILYLLSQKKSVRKNVIFPFPKIGHYIEGGINKYCIVYYDIDYKESNMYARNKEKEDDLKDLKNEALASFCYLFLRFGVLPLKVPTDNKQTKNTFCNFFCKNKEKYFVLIPFFDSYKGNDQITFDTFLNEMSNYPLHETLVKNKDEILNKIKGNKPFFGKLSFLFYDQFREVINIKENPIDIFEKKNVRDALLDLLNQNQNKNKNSECLFSPTLDFLKDDINQNQEKVIFFFAYFVWFRPKLCKKDEAEKKKGNETQYTKSLTENYNSISEEGKKPEEIINEFESIIKSCIDEGVDENDCFFNILCTYADKYIEFGKFCLENSKIGFDKIGFDKIERFFKIIALSTFSSEAFLSLANLYKPDLPKWKYLESPNLYKSDVTKYSVYLNISAALRNQTAVNDGAKFFMKNNMYSNADFILSWIDLSNSLNSAILTQNEIFFYFNDLRAPSTAFFFANINVNAVKEKDNLFFNDEKLDRNKATQFLYMVYKSRIQTADMFLKVFDIYEYKNRFFDNNEKASVLSSYMLAVQSQASVYNYIIPMCKEIIKSLEDIINPKNDNHNAKSGSSSEDEKTLIEALIKYKWFNEIMDRGEFKELKLAAQRAICELDLLYYCSIFAISKPQKEDLPKQEPPVFTRLKKLLEDEQYTPAAVPLALIHFKVFISNPNENSRNKSQNSLITDENIEYIIDNEDRQKILQDASYSNEYFLVAINNGLLKNYGHIHHFVNMLSDKVSENIKLYFKV